MGSVPAVSYANIYMARKIDPKILAVAEKFKNSDGNPVKFMKRFLDDIVMIWRGLTVDLHKFLNDINNIYPSIKFTMSHTTNANSTCDLYKKSTDRNRNKENICTSISIVPNQKA